MWAFINKPHHETCKLFHTKSSKGYTLFIPIPPAIPSSNLNLKYKNNNKKIKTKRETNPTTPKRENKPLGIEKSLYLYTYMWSKSLTIAPTEF